MFVNTIIESTGIYLPDNVVPNSAFLSRTFLDGAGNKINKSNTEIIEKLEAISQIEERRYENTSNTHIMASNAAQNAFDKSSIKKEELGGIIVAHNFGDIDANGNHGQMIPNLAAKVKHDLGIKNSKCFAYDVLYGCPGWLLAMEQANLYLQSGIAKSILIIGVESLSRVINENDLDAMLFGDGAGAAILKSEESDVKRGVLGYNNHSDCIDELEFLKMSQSKSNGGHELYLDMNGRNVFKYAVNNLPGIISECLKDLGISIKDVDQFLFHQANGKMIQAIGNELSSSNDGLCLENKVPVNLQKLGNTSVATIPILIDMILENQIENYSLKKDDLVVMASVGAGMHANCLVYKF